jgi:hypothetical protein
VALHSKIVIFQIDIEIRQDQPVFDKAHMMRATSSPSSSTTGLATLLFAIAVTLVINPACWICVEPRVRRESPDHTGARRQRQRLSPCPAVAGLSSFTRSCGGIIHRRKNSCRQSRLRRAIDAWVIEERLTNAQENNKISSLQGIAHFLGDHWQIVDASAQPAGVERFSTRLSTALVDRAAAPKIPDAPQTVAAQC